MRLNQIHTRKPMSKNVVEGDYLIRPGTKQDPLLPHIDAHFQCCGYHVCSCTHIPRPATPEDMKPGAKLCFGEEGKVYTVVGPELPDQTWMLKGDIKVDYASRYYLENKSTWILIEEAPVLPERPELNPGDRVMFRDEDNEVWTFVRWEKAEGVFRTGSLTRWISDRALVTNCIPYRLIS